MRRIPKVGAPHVPLKSRVDVNIDMLRTADLAGAVAQDVLPKISRLAGFTLRKHKITYEAHKDSSLSKKITN